MVRFEPVEELPQEGRKNLNLIRLLKNLVLCLLLKAVTLEVDVEVKQYVLPSAALKPCRKKIIYQFTKELLLWQSAKKEP